MACSTQGPAAPQACSPETSYVHTLTDKQVEAGRLHFNGEAGAACCSLSEMSVGMGWRQELQSHQGMWHVPPWSAFLLLWEQPCWGHHVCNPSTVHCEDSARAGPMAGDSAKRLGVAVGQSRPVLLRLEHEPDAFTTCTLYRNSATRQYLIQVRRALWYCALVPLQSAATAQPLSLSCVGSCAFPHGVICAGGSWMIQGTRGLVC